MHETPAEIARREIAYRQGRPLKIVGMSAHLVDGRFEVVVEVLERWHGGEAIVCHVCTDTPAITAPVTTNGKAGERSDG